LSRLDDDSFDVVLCLGPFYHLAEPAQREQTASELVRVVKPNCTVFVALVPIYTFLGRTITHKDEQHHLTQPEFVSRLMNDGVFLNDVPNRFNAGYGVRPREVAPFFEKHGLKTLEMLADTGFVGLYAQHLAELAESAPEAHEIAMEIIISTAHDPSIWGTSIHLVYVGQKSAQ
jgi:hypothetical protein